MFQSWRKQEPVHLDVTRLVARVNLSPTNANASIFSATSGDYGRIPLKHGYYTLCNSHGMLFQASPSNVASVTVVCTQSAAVADGLATCAMLFVSIGQAQRFLHSVREKFGIAQFYIVSRGGCVDHTTPLEGVEELAEPILIGGLCLSGTFAFLLIKDMLTFHSYIAEVTLGQLNSEMTPISITEGISINSARIVSLSPPLCSILLPDPATNSATLKRFQIHSHSCAVLHQSGQLLIASISGVEGAQLRTLRRACDTPFVAIVTVQQVQMKCSSLSWTQNCVSFNAEVGGAMATLLLQCKPGIMVRVVLESMAKTIVCGLREVATVGDHVICVCGVLEEHFN
jgi:hypothetical protein